MKMPGTVKEKAVYADVGKAPGDEEGIAVGDDGIGGGSRDTNRSAAWNAALPKSNGSGPVDDGYNEDGIGDESGAEGLENADTGSAGIDDETDDSDDDGSESDGMGDASAADDVRSTDDESAYQFEAEDEGLAAYDAPLNEIDEDSAGQAEVAT